MFIGHFAAGLAAKKVSPKTSLASLFIAGQLLDLIWPIAVLAGLEKVTIDYDIPTFNGLNLISADYSHSLGMTIIWGLMFGGLIWLVRRDFREAAVLFTVVVSHWFLDYFTHVPDMSLWFNSDKYGLGLWKLKHATFFVETLIFALGIHFYLQTRRFTERKSKILFWSMIGFLYLFYVGHVYGPTPPATENPIDVAAPAFAMWLIVVWAYFADKKKRA